MSNFIVNAEARDDQGKGASRRLRHQGMVPAIIYGAGKDPVAIAVNHNEMLRHLEDEAFYSHVLTIDLGKGKEKAILKDLQRHPARPIIMHADFLRIDENSKLRAHVPLHFVGADTAPGVKAGGVLTHNTNEVVVQCLPKDLPEFVEADCSILEIGHSLHLSQLKLPKGVELVELLHGEGHDQAVASVMGTRATTEATPAAGEGGE